MTTNGEKDNGKLIRFRNIDYGFVVVFFAVASAGWSLLYNSFDAIRANEQAIIKAREDGIKVKDEIRGEINTEAARIERQMAELRGYLLSCPGVMKEMPVEAKILNLDGGR